MRSSFLSSNPPLQSFNVLNFCSQLLRGFLSAKGSEGWMSCRGKTARALYKFMTMSYKSKTYSYPSMGQVCRTPLLQGIIEVLLLGCASKAQGNSRESWLVCVRKDISLVVSLRLLSLGFLCFAMPSVCFTPHVDHSFSRSLWFDFCLRRSRQV